MATSTDNRTELELEFGYSLATDRWRAEDDADDRDYGIDDDGYPHASERSGNYSALLAYEYPTRRYDR